MQTNTSGTRACAFLQHPSAATGDVASAMLKCAVSQIPPQPLILTHPRIDLNNLQQRADEHHRAMYDWLCDSVCV